MKKFFRFVGYFLAIAVMSVATFGLAACEDIKKVQLTLKLYNSSDAVYYDTNDVTMSIDLYRHLAPKTVDVMLAYVNSGYYDGAIFYKDMSYSNQIMVGDLKFENGALVQNLIDGKTPSEIYGEFEYNGTSGSNLTSVKGAVGVWRSWYASNTDKYKTSNAMDSGRATWYLPTSSIGGYDGYFCIFGQYDTSNTANSTAISALSGIFSSEDTYTEYVIYYTGEYNAEKPDENYGLTFHAILSEMFDEDLVEGEIFEAEGDQLVCYNKKTVRIPVVGGKIYAQITTAAVK